MIRRATNKDIPKIIDLLKQVCLVHHKGRPDIFKVGTKYSTDLDRRRNYVYATFWKIGGSRQKNC